MAFTNVYYKRTAGTARSCYVCYRSTTTVLATLNTVDFIYSCPGHLSDSNFATRIMDESASARPSVSPEEIARIKQEWEDKQKKKGREKEGKEGSKVPSPGTLSTPGPSATPSQTHERYSLHRDFYAMRLLEHKKRRQAAQAKELAPRLPGAPTANVEDKY